MRHRGKIWLLVLCAAALVPGGVHAQAQCGGATIPEGNAQIDEYTETIPGACGDAQPSGSGEGGDAAAEAGSGGEGGVPPGTAEELQSLGDDGAAAASLAEATAPSTRSRGSDGAQEAGGAAPANDDQGSALGQVARAVTGSNDGGIGILLPLILAGTLIAAIAFVVRRRTHTTQA